MKRILYSDLKNWKNSRNRKPLLLQGVRQAGKTFLIKQFGNREYDHLICLDFEENPDLSALFYGGLNPKTIIENISFYIGKKITSENTLLFFDEIQKTPNVLTSLKYFHEQAPEYHVIAAGSLLGVSVSKQSSFPVGKVNFLTLHPMTFFEYLVARGENLLADRLNSVREPVPLPDSLHNKLLKHHKLFLFLGGMPEVVKEYIDHQDIAEARDIQIDILEAYSRDFSKYTENYQADKSAEVWQSIPSQLARENKKFKYSEVRKKARAATFEESIRWIKNAGLINVAYCLTKPELPLSGYSDYLKFKLYLADTGLLGAMLKLPSDIILHPVEIFRKYNGAFMENYVAQELTAQNYKPLFYWTSKSDAEVDFILQKGNNVYPLEVKSGTSLNLKSLRSYAGKYSPKLIFRSSPRNFIRSGNFINIPLYAISALQRYLP